MSSDLAQRVPSQPRAVLDSLSARERDVFLLLARGSTPKQLAGELGISVKTAYVHRARVIEKLGARNDRDLYRLALEAGVLGA